MSQPSSHRYPKSLASVIGGKRVLMVLLVVVLFSCLYLAGIRVSSLKPSEYGLKLSYEFLVAAVQPALSYEAGPPSADAPPFLIKVLTALWLTFQYALCSMSVALVIGFIGGFFSSSSWWPENPNRPLKIALRGFFLISRFVVTLGRSVHELIWALLILTALGTTPLAGIIAISIPYGCTLAKIFSEMIDEQAGIARETLSSIGAKPMQNWLFGCLPLAFTDMLSYTLYRFECALRSSAILGFVGIPTIGYHIVQAFEDFHLRELWTYLYALLAMIILSELWGKSIRARFNGQIAEKTNACKNPSLKQLKSQRPKSWWLRISGGIALTTTIFAWLNIPAARYPLSWQRRLSNLESFFQQIVPYPVQKSGDWADAWPWAKNLLAESGTEAMMMTLYIATAAAIMAGVGAVLSMLWASARLNRMQSFETYTGNSRTELLRRRLTRTASHFVLLIARSSPEYILAFLLLQIFGPTAWPLILGLAIHNFGLMGRLYSELVDNHPAEASKQSLLAGGNRVQTYFGAILPQVFNRYLLYFFYRWETCVRDSTVLGMLGILSLGFLITDAKTRLFYDNLMFFVLLGALLVFIGDMLSYWIRAKLRQLDHS